MRAQSLPRTQDSDVGDAEEHLRQEATQAEFPAGRRLGIVGYDFAASGRSKCVVCDEHGLPNADCEIAKDCLRYAVRVKARKPERYVHEACVLSGAVLGLRGFLPEHVAESARCIGDAAFGDEVPEDLKGGLLDACDVFREALSGPASSSGDKA